MALALAPDHARRVNALETALRERGKLLETRADPRWLDAVEAQAAGTPVLFSPVSSLVDLIGPLSWTNVPEDFDGWLASLKEVLALPAPARAQKAAEGIAWARRFSCMP